MLPSLHNDAKPARCRFTHGILPGIIQPPQEPCKKAPAKTIAEHELYHTVELILERDNDDAVDLKLSGLPFCGSFAKVHMPLIDILDGEIFNTVIKGSSDDVKMISQGRPGLDNYYFLSQGVLHLQIDKAIYERTGLPGRPVVDGGLKHVKRRFEVEINLRLPSMLHGKKGFERVRWAFRNVLTETVTWLIELKFPENLDLDPSYPHIKKHHPQVYVTQAKRRSTASVRRPKLIADPSTIMDSQAFVDDDDQVKELEEWLALAFLQSERLTVGNEPDAFISRYSPPGVEGSGTESIETMIISLRGLITAKSIISALNAAKQAIPNGWLGVKMHSFQGDHIAVLKLPKRGDMEKFLQWEYVNPIGKLKS